MNKISLKNNSKWGDEVFSLLSWFVSDKVKKARVMVVGAGALGNEVLKNLALFGVGNIVVVDFDTIEYSNLCRSVLFREQDAINKSSKALIAAQRIKEINPDIKVMTMVGDVRSDVGLGVFKRMDVVIACLDSRFARFIVNQQCFRADIPWVDGGIENLNGNVRVFKRGINCYECGLTSPELEMLKVKTGCPDVAKLNYKYGRIATTPVSSSIIGAIQVQEAIKLIHGFHLKTPNSYPSSLLLGKMFSYDGLYLTSKIFSMLSYNDDCLSHDVWKPVLSIKELGADTKVNDALAIIKKYTKSETVEINMLNNKFIVSISPENTNKFYELLIPESKLNDFIQNNTLDIDISKKIYQNYIENIDDNFKYKDLTLKQVGFPYLDIIQVATSSGIKYIEFGKDKSHLNFQ